MEARTIALFVTAIIALLSFIFSVYNNNYSKKWQEEERKIRFFSEYTKRYQDIILHLINGKENTDAYLHLYFDLCSEEYYLHEHNCLPEEVWKMWHDGMILFMKVKSYQTAWNTKFAQMYNPDFYYFFNREVIAKSNI